VKERVDQIEARLAAVEARTLALEAGMIRVERQLHLVFEQGQSVSKQLGEQSSVLRDVRETLQALAMRGMGRE
jgi:hypothetical protein